MSPIHEPEESAGTRAAGTTLSPMGQIVFGWLDDVLK
jgi:hypothetical protein